MPKCQPRTSTSLIPAEGKLYRKPGVIAAAGIVFILCIAAFFTLLIQPRHMPGQIPDWDISAYCRHKDESLNARQYGPRFAHENCVRSTETAKLNPLTPSQAEAICDSDFAMRAFGRPSLEECAAEEAEWRRALIIQFDWKQEFITEANEADPRNRPRRLMFHDLDTCVKSQDENRPYFSYLKLFECVNPAQDRL